MQMKFVENILVVAFKCLLIMMGGIKSEWIQLIIMVLLGLGLAVWKEVGTIGLSEIFLDIQDMMISDKDFGFTSETKKETAGILYLNLSTNDFKF